MEIKELKNYLKNLPDLLDKDDAVKRRKKALKSFEYFVKTYFAHHIGGENVKETSEFRRFIYKNLERLALENRHLVFESYRGSAKTTLITRLFTLYSLIKRKKYAVIISSTLDIAKESLETIKTEIEENAKLKNDFALEVGYLWTSDEIIFRASRAIKKIKVFGAGKKIRGTNFLGNRPDLIVLDDVENDENIQSKAQRDKLFNWFFKAILKLNFIGSKDYNYIIVGTRLHHDGLLARLADIYSSFKFKLIKEFPPFFDEITKENYRNFNYCDMKIDDEKMGAGDLKWINMRILSYLKTLNFKYLQKFKNFLPINLKIALNKGAVNLSVIKFPNLIKCFRAKIKYFVNKNINNKNRTNISAPVGGTYIIFILLFIILAYFSI